MKHWKLLTVAALTLAITAQAAEPEKHIYIEAKVFKLLDKEVQEWKLLENAAGGTLCISAEECARLLEKIAATKSAETISAPKLLTADTRTATVRVGQDHRFVASLDVQLDKNAGARFVPKMESRPVGLSLSFTPVISADQKFVRVTSECSLTRVSPTPVRVPVTSMVTPVFEGGSQGAPVPFTQFIEQPAFDTQTQQVTMAIPVGNTLLMKLGSSECVSRTEFGPPVLSQIPYVNRLFKNVGIATETIHSFVLITPTIATAKPAPAPPATLPMPVERMTRTVPVQAYPQPVPSMPATLVPHPLQSNFEFKIAGVQGAAPLALPPRPVAATVPCCPPPVHGAASFACQSVPTAPQQCTPPCTAACTGDMVVRARNIEITTAAPAKNPAILKILLEQYEVACKTGDAAKARTIAAFCLEMDPTCFAKR